MKVEINEIKSTDTNLSVIFKDSYMMGRQAALKAWGAQNE